MKIAVDQTVAGIATEFPPAVAALERLGIDYCCSGDRSLRQACDDAGIDTDAALREIDVELTNPSAPDDRWDQVPLSELVDHILVAFHGPLRQDLPRLESMARQVVDAHRDKEPVVLPEVLSALLGLKAELEDHMEKEEQILFPMIKQGQGWMADGPISIMHDEHDSADAALARLHEITDGYRPHPDACATWEALWQGLASLERSLHRHIHLENNILFPRALAAMPGAAGA